MAPVTTSKLHNLRFYSIHNLVFGLCEKSVLTSENFERRKMFQQVLSLLLPGHFFPRKFKFIFLKLDPTGLRARRDFCEACLLGFRCCAWEWDSSMKTPFFVGIHNSTGATSTLLDPPLHYICWHIFWNSEQFIWPWRNCYVRIRREHDRDSTWGRHGELHLPQQHLESVDCVQLW